MYLIALVAYPMLCAHPRSWSIPVQTFLRMAMSAHGNMPLGIYLALVLLVLLPSRRVAAIWLDFLSKRVLMLRIRSLVAPSAQVCPGQFVSVGAQHPVGCRYRPGGWYAGHVSDHVSLSSHDSRQCRHQDPAAHKGVQPRRKTTCLLGRKAA